MVDLIIPVYNEEDKLDKLMGSICAQTKDHAIMVTVVNDHSTDRSVEILERWKEFVSFPMQILTPPEKLKYPGLVRQYGIDHTRCEYIMFCDGDDELMPRAVELLTRSMLMKNSDIVFSNFIVENERQDYEQGISNGGMTWLHGNLYKRRFLEENNIHFQSGYNEDGTFNLWCILYTDNIFQCQESTYIWKNNKKSITRNQDNYVVNNFEDIVYGYLSIYQKFLNDHPNIMSKESLTELEERKVKKYWENCLGHLNLIYSWFNGFCVCNLPQERMKKIISIIFDFIIGTKLQELLNTVELSDYYKMQITKHKPELIYITLNDFLRMFDIHCDLRPRKAIEQYGGDLS